MSQLLVWPSLAEPYASALKAAVNWILAEYKPIGIVVCGSIIRGEGDASSDLDIHVVHTEPWRQRVQKWFGDVPTEIFINPPAQIRRYFVEERVKGRPATAHMLSTGFIVLSKDDQVDALQSEARQIVNSAPNAPESALSQQRYMAATLLEDAFDIAEKDPGNALYLLEQAMPLMMQYAFLAGNRPLPRAKQMVAKLAELDANLGAIARQFYTTVLPEERFGLARSFAQQALGSTGFFAWTGEQQQVAEP